MDRVGRQSPTVSVILPYTETNGPEAVELYNISENNILPWQEALTYDIIAVDGDGLWIHQKFGYSVPRRNGKSEMALARCIWGLKNGERILYTAHRASTAHSIWERLTFTRGGKWSRIKHYLSTSEKLLPFGIKVYCLNPKSVKNYKESYVDLPKNDGIDSFVIADFARCGRITIKPWKGAQYLALQRLTRHRLHITECIAREKVYMLNNIFLKFSEFAFLQKDEHPFSNKYGATAEAVLTEFTTTEEIVNSSVEDLVDLITVRSCGRITNPLNAAELLQKAARDSYRLDKCMYEPLTTSIACSFNCIRAFEKELKALDAAIEEAVKGLNPTEYQILRSVPGIGKVYGAGILAEMGSVKYYKNHNSLAKYSGIYWNQNQSGDFDGEDTSMSKAGNRYLRYYLIEAAGSVIQHCPEYRVYYEKKYAEVLKHQHKRALALTSRKLIRMLFGLLDKSQLYSPGKE